MTKLTDEELAAIRARADKATKGPWTVIPPVPYDGEDEDTQGAYVDPGGVEDADGNPVCAFGDPGGSGHLYEHPDNPAFIAATRQDVPALLEHINTITAELSLAQAELAANSWRPIEQAPRDGTKFDTWDGRRRMVDVYWSDVEGWWAVDGLHGPEEPAPLPTFPRPTHFRHQSTPPTAKGSAT